MIFSNFIFLILVLLILNTVPSSSPASLLTPIAGFCWGMLMYFGVLTVIVLQNFVLRKRLSALKSSLLILANLELMGFLLIFHFVFEAHRLLFIELPTSPFQFFGHLFSLGLYFCGLSLFYFSSHYFHYRMREPWRKARRHTGLQIRLLVPFALPFVFFSLLMDLLKIYPDSTIYHFFMGTDAAMGSFSLFFASLVFMGIMMIFLPALIQWIWGCKPLKESQLKRALDDLCQRTKFKHAGMKTWTILNQTMTAAIIGIVPKYRYVMFTQGLLNALDPRLITAVLAHEIGHSYRRHLLIFPFILFGMITCVGLFGIWFSEGLVQYLTFEKLTHPSAMWDYLEPFLVYIPLALIVGLYFRFVFGFFSRLFERQADLHCYIADVPVQDMIDALDQLAIATGHSHDTPSWHHYSINERIHFLQKTQAFPEAILQHHRKVKLYLALYFSLLLFLCGLLFAPFQSNIQPFKLFYKWDKAISQTISDTITKQSRKELISD